MRWAAKRKFGCEDRRKNNLIKCLHSKIQNLNIETRNKFKKLECPKRIRLSLSLRHEQAPRCFCHSEFGDLNLFWISDFVLRI